MSQPASHEILVVDGDVKVQRGLAQLLSGEGFVPTVLGDPARARALVEERFFALALVDLDTPLPGAGLELVRWLRERSPTTNVVVLASRKAFEAVVEAFRAGASDVILKAPDQVEHLRQRVLQARDNVRTTPDGDVNLLGDVLSVHEDFLKRLMDAERRASELEERASAAGQPKEEESDCGVLVVEEGGWLAKQLAEELRARGGYTLRVAASGGEGLDAATGGRFAIALVRDTLPDLPGTMVVRTLKSQSPQTIVILYSAPGKRPGKADVIEGSKTISLLPEFESAGQMVERLDDLRDAFRAKSRERKYLSAFRQQHYDLLRRYAELKQRIQRVIKP